MEKMRLKWLRSISIATTWGCLLNFYAYGGCEKLDSEPKIEEIKSPFVRLLNRKIDNCMRDGQIENAIKVCSSLENMTDKTIEKEDGNLNKTFMGQIKLDNNSTSESASEYEDVQKAYEILNNSLFGQFNDLCKKENTNDIFQSFCGNRDSKETIFNKIKNDINKCKDWLEKNKLEDEQKSKNERIEKIRRIEKKLRKKKREEEKLEKEKEKENHKKQQEKERKKAEEKYGIMDLTADKGSGKKQQIVPGENVLKKDASNSPHILSDENKENGKGSLSQAQQGNHLTLKKGENN